jgi:hypothetical protein
VPVRGRRGVAGGQGLTDGRGVLVAELPPREESGVRALAGDEPGDRPQRTGHGGAAPRRQAGEVDDRRALVPRRRGEEFAAAGASGDRKAAHRRLPVIASAKSDSRYLS